MFTGIIQSIGTVGAIRRGPKSIELSIDAPQLHRPIRPGASIAVNGVCLTVTDDRNGRIDFDMVAETAKRSTLGQLRVNESVNLEPALRAGDPLDGHMVQGHVDGIGEIAKIQTNASEHIITIRVGEKITPYLIPKGSVAIDGISLTIAEVRGNEFDVAIIPTTLAETTLKNAKSGGNVNIETDIIVRTIVTTLERLGGAKSSKGLTMEMLTENGW